MTLDKEIAQKCMQHKHTLGAIIIIIAVFFLGVFVGHSTGRDYDGRGRFEGHRGDRMEQQYDRGYRNDYNKPMPAPQQTPDSTGAQVAPVDPMVPAPQPAPTTGTGVQ